MATVAEIQEKINKANADIEKRMERVTKLEAKEVKLLNALKAFGIDISDYNRDEFRSKRAKKPNTYGHFFYDDLCASDVLRNHISNFEIIQNDNNAWSAFLDLTNCINSQSGSWNKIFELEDKLTRLDTELQKAQLKQKEVEDIPPILEELRTAIYESILNNMKHMRDEIIACKQRMREHPDMRREIMEQLFERIGKTNYQMFSGRADEELEKFAEKDAEHYVLDLIHRVTKKVGKITDYKGIYVNGPAINGRIIGERGDTYLQTIIAGGEVQCLHYRVLLK